MVCKYCGSELMGNEKFCGKCGAKTDFSGVTNQENINNSGAMNQENINNSGVMNQANINNSRVMNQANIGYSGAMNQENINNKSNNVKPIKLKLTQLIIIIIITVIVCGGGLYFIIRLKGSGILNKNTISQTQMIEILKGSDNGLYLQAPTVKVGTSADINYQNYNKLVSYSCVFVNNQVTLNAGGIMLYNTSTKEQKILNLDTALMSIIYYLNTQQMSQQLDSTTRVVAEFIGNHGIEKLSISSKEYMEMGKEIGQIVGVKLCRNIAAQAMVNLGAYNPSIASFLYKPDEIFPRYMGMNITEQEYCWEHILDEKSAKMIAAYNEKTYRQLVAIYGSPYRDVSKFIVFDATKEGNSEVGKYSNKEKAKEKLGVEE